MPEGPQVTGKETDQTTIGDALRFAAATLVVLAFSLPALPVFFPSLGSTAVATAMALAPIGVLLLKRLSPRISYAAAVARLMWPIGFVWLMAGAVSFTDYTDIDSDPYLMAGGALALAAGFIASSGHRSGRQDDPAARHRGPTAVVHLYTRVIGLAMICVAIAVPIIANAFPAEQIAAAPISLGLIPVGGLLATRPLPRSASSALVATVLLPAGAIWFLVGALSVEHRRGLQPDAAVMTAGGAVLLVAAGAAWTAWGSRNKSTAQIVLQAVAVVVWIAAGTASIQAMSEPHDIYIEPMAMQIYGSQLFLEVPLLGACGDSFLSLDTELDGDLLHVTLTRSSEEFDVQCESWCLSSVVLMCTNHVAFTLEAPPPPGTTPVATPPPPTGLLRVPLVWLIGGMALGAAIFMSGRKFSVPADVPVE